MKREFHIFDVNGDTLMALPTGEVFILDEVGAAVARCSAGDVNEAVAMLCRNYPSQDIQRAWEQFHRATSNPPRDHRHHSPPRNLRALCLNITHRCNLACSYCFAEKLTTGDRRTMTGDVLRQAFDFLFASSGDVRRLQVDFFGGEPMLAFEQVKEGVRYARKKEEALQKKVLFTLTTNATALDREKIKYFRDSEVSLILSLDGPREVNDACRRYPDGSGSYKKIIENIRMVRSMLEPQQYYIRGTFTAKSRDILETLKYYDREGFYNVSLEPVSAPEESPLALGKEHLEEILKKYHQTARWMLDREMVFYHFNLETDNPLCLTRRITGCGAGVEYMAVDPRGDLYPCHQFIEFPQFRLGNVFQGVNAGNIATDFRNSTLYQKEGCSSCWARFYCGGGCHFQHYVGNGSIHRPSSSYCELFRGRLEAALWYNARRNFPCSQEILNCCNGFS